MAHGEHETAASSYASEKMECCASVSDYHRPDCPEYNRRMSETLDRLKSLLQRSPDWINLPSTTVVVLRASAAVFLLTAATDCILGELSRHAPFRFADDLIAAVAVGCLVLFYERRRRGYFAGRLQIIREMNHHVRNALTVISLTSQQQPNEDLRSMMRESVGRIDWALREVLPLHPDAGRPSCRL